MHASNIEVREVDGRVELSAQIEFETTDPGMRRIWYRIPADLASPDRFGDTLLAALLVPAMSLGERLRIDVPVSRPVFEAATEVLTPRLRRWGWDERRINIDCDIAEWSPTDTETRGRGAFFSGGVDSWYSVLKHRSLLDQLIFVRGIEIPISETPRWSAALDLNQKSALMLGKALVIVETNVHTLAIHDVPRRAKMLGQKYYSYSIERYSGCMLASIALLLQKAFGHVTIATTFPFEYLIPQGSHFLLEPAWSSEVIEFDLDGGEAGRSEKIEAIASWMPGALGRLRVCFAKNREELNCGECEKCLRTLLAMRATGNLDHATSFARPPDLGKIRVLSPTHQTVWREVRNASVRSGDAELQRAIDKAIRWAYWRDIGKGALSPLGQLYRATRRLLRPIRAVFR